MPLVRGRYSVTNPQWELAGSPSGMFRANMPRHAVSVNTVAAGATGVLLSVALPLEAGDLVSNLTFISGDTAADTPTHWGFALYDTAATPAKVATSADKTSTAWAASTVKTLAMTTAYLVPVSGIYRASVWMAATAVVTLAGAAGPAVGLGSVFSTDIPLAVTSNTALTTAAPSSLGAQTVAAGCPLVIAT